MTLNNVNLVPKDTTLVLICINAFRFPHTLNKLTQDKHLISFIMEILMLSGWQIIIKILLRTKIWLIALKLIHIGMNIHALCVHKKSHTITWSIIFVRLVHQEQHMTHKFMSAWVKIMWLLIRNPMYKNFWQESSHDYL